MKVKELINQLEKQDPNADVVIWELIVGDGRMDMQKFRTLVLFLRAIEI